MFRIPCFRHPRRSHFTYWIRALVHCRIQTSANTSWAQAAHRKAINGFRGNGPIEVNMVAFSNPSQIGNRLRKVQRRRLRHARNPAARKRGGAGNQ